MEELSRTIEQSNPRCSTCGSRSKQIFHVKSFHNPNLREEFIKDASVLCVIVTEYGRNATLSRVETHLSGNNWKPACRDASIDFFFAAMQRRSWSGVCMYWVALKPGRV